MPFVEALNPYVEKIRTQANVHGESFESLWALYENRYAIVDLGCGNGHFLEAYLQSHPEFHGLGIERRFKRTFKTAQKFERHCGDRGRVVHGDVFEFLKASPSTFWNEVWLQFPDPWPKDRHSKNRIVNDLLFQEIYRILKPQGRFAFRSDCRLYWENLQLWNSKYEFFPITKSLKGNLFENTPSSLYLQKMRERQVPIYSLEFVKLS